MFSSGAARSTSVHGMIESDFRVEWRPLAELAPIATQWQSLAARALAPNVFYEPAFALAAAPVLGRDVGAGLVWSRAAPLRLLGFFPARIERRRYGIALPVLVGWTHPYGPLGTPLMDRDAGAAVLSAWLDHLAGQGDLPRLLLMPYFPAAGPVGQAFDAALARRHGESISLARHERALLAPAGAREHYLDHAMGAKKRKELRRQRKRLAEAGALVSDTVRDPAAIAAALADFLALEAAGWKGRAGTAARADDSVRAFMEKAVTGLARDGKARIDRLSTGGAPIAAIVTLQSGATAWCWKIAYDEAFARSSPGVLLLLDVTQALLDDPTIAGADSCATADHPMIDHVWRERVGLADRLVRLGPQGRFAFAAACRLERLRRTAIAGVKRLRDLTRR
jgi:CelD/BcsL family acetyltransferase involved in cellulose biosynthesis